MQRLRVGDEVVVLAGRSRGRRGKLLRFTKDGRAIVEGLNMVKRHQRPNPQLDIEGGILDQEAPIQASNLALYDAESDRPSRVGFREEDGRKVRFFKSSGKAVAEVSAPAAPAAEAPAQKAEAEG